DDHSETELRHAAQVRIARPVMVGRAIEASSRHPRAAGGRIAAEIPEILDAVEVDMPCHPANLAVASVRIETADARRRFPQTGYLRSTFHRLGIDSRLDSTPRPTTIKMDQGGAGRLSPAFAGATEPTMSEPASREPARADPAGSGPPGGLAAVIH